MPDQYGVSNTQFILNCNSCVLRAMSFRVRTILFYLKYSTKFYCILCERIKGYSSLASQTLFHDTRKAC